MDVKLWNVACLGKYVWEIYSKQENVWIKWINAVYLRGEDWWDYKPKVEASWYCKKICGVKEQMKTKYTNEELVRMMKYSIKGVYEAMKGANSKIEQTKCVWNRLSIRHRFIQWLAMQGMLQTKAMLAQIGINSCDLCLLCGAQAKTHQHLLFNCVYSNACFTHIKQWQNSEQVQQK